MKCQMAGAGTGAKEATTTIPAAFVPGFWVRDLVRRQRYGGAGQGSLCPALYLQGFFPCD
jgi:hypothetical protein